jgi:hypothetical protein
MTVNAYAASKAAFDGHVAKLNQLAEMLSNAAAGLKSRPGRMSFSNTSGSLPIAARINADSITIDAMGWKGAAQIQEMLARWHELRDILLSRWLALSTDARANVATPEGAVEYALAAAKDEERRRSNGMLGPLRTFLKPAA